MEGSGHMAVMRRSRQRDAIFAELSSRCDHPTADELYQSLKGDYPSLSLATVYRNLNQLSEEGKVLRISGDTSDHYDAYTAPHYHFSCTECHQLFDLDVPGMPEIGSIAQSHYGGYIDSYSLIFKGVCEKCAELKSNEV